MDDTTQIICRRVKQDKTTDDEVCPSVHPIIRELLVFVFSQHETDGDMGKVCYHTQLSMQQYATCRVATAEKSER